MPDPSVSRSEHSPELEGPWLTPPELEAILVGLRHLMGEPFTGDLRDLNPLWRAVIRKIEEVNYAG